MTTILFGSLPGAFFQKVKKQSFGVVKLILGLVSSFF